MDKLAKVGKIMVELPKNHIVIDFDLSNGKEKLLLQSLKEALKCTKSYTELNENCSGMHIHYIYDYVYDGKSIKEN